MHEQKRSVAFKKFNIHNTLENMYSDVNLIPSLYHCR